MFPSDFSDFLTITDYTDPGVAAAATIIKQLNRTLINYNNYDNDSNDMNSNTNNNNNNNNNYNKNNHFLSFNGMPDNYNINTNNNANANTDVASYNNNYNENANSINFNTYNYNKNDNMNINNNNNTNLNYEDFNNVSTSDSIFFIASNSSGVATASNVTNTIITQIRPEIPIWLIPCYSILLLAAIVGNLLVISTLVQNRRMRTITNLFLLNLAISDILLGVLCMPVTLVGTLLRRFIFGEFLCKLIQFSQATSVAVSSWTLVAISCERYYAICHPLRSRTWQTINHAYKIIGFIWIGSIICMTPIAVFSKLLPTSRQGLRKCREVWPKDIIGYERSYNIMLDLLLLVLPLIILCVAYILITRTLYVGMRNERAMIFGGSSGSSSKHNTQVEGVATVTTTLMPASTGFNLNGMSFRSCHSARTNSVNNVPEAYQQEHQLQQQQRIQRQQQQQQHQQQQNQQQQQCYDDITHSTKRKLFTDGRKQFYCMRSASVKSLNRNFKNIEFGRQTGNGHGGGGGGVGGDASGASAVVSIVSGGGGGVGASVAATAASGSIIVSSVNSGGSSGCSSSTPGSSSQSMTVINMPQQQRFQLHQHRQADSDRRKSTLTPTMRVTDSALRRSNETKNLESKKRVVKMLFVLVLEFFICWTPLYVINTVTMFIGQAMYEYIDYTSISFFQLLAYSSSCCNPITYCFMNAGFRRAFLDTFKGMQLNSGKFWRKRTKSATAHSAGAGNSIALTTSVTLLSNHGIESPRR